MSSTPQRKEFATELPHDRKLSLELAPNAVTVLQSRYLKKDPSGACTEQPEDMFDRVAQTVAGVEKQYGADHKTIEKWNTVFYNLMASKQFMPNSPTLMNAGRDMGMLSACFVLPVRDSIDEIFESIKHTALIQKAGGGTGFAFDELRPTGDFIRSSGGTTSGPISFWKAFSEATNAIQQGAFRRGANMGMMYIHHPDILKFLHAKQDLEQFTNYNISVKITDAWMDSFKNDPHQPHVVRNPRSGQQYYLPSDLDIWEYDVKALLPASECTVVDNTGDKAVVEHNGAERKVYSCNDIWQFIITNAHATGEPGVVFIDRINEHNPTPHVGRIEATNPCGEQPLLPYEACNLGSINVGAFVVERDGKAQVDWDALRNCVHIATRFLENVIDANNYPLEQIDQMCKGNRKIGLGLMGFADALYKMHLPYNSQQGVEFGEQLMKFINDEAHNASENLAAERGCFPNWAGSTWDTAQNRPMRNAAVTTVAPTGTISMIAGCSGGIEPMFSLVFYRNVLRERKGGPMLEIHEDFKQLAQERGFYSDELMERIAQAGTLHDVADIPDDVKQVFVCAHDITPEWHMKMQAAFQKHCDSSISKTINFPESAAVGDVEEIYRLAYDYGCKGVTVYRDNCRKYQPMALSKKNNEDAGKAQTTETEDTQAQAPKPQAKEQRFEPVYLPDCLPSVRMRQMTPFGHMHVNITVDPSTESEMEVFAQLGKGGDLAASDLEAICRMVSLFLRSGGRLRHVISQLNGIGSSLTVPSRDGRIMSLGDGLAKALKRYSRAKEMFGLEALLLGQVDFSELDNPNRKPTPGAKKTQESVKKSDPEATSDNIPVVAGNGNGNGNGHNGNGNGNGSGNGHKKPATAVPETAAGVQVFVDTVVMAEEKPVDLMGQSRMEQFKVKCPECNVPLSFQEGCVKCHCCGYSQC